MGAGWQIDWPALRLASVIDANQVEAGGSDQNRAGWLAAKIVLARWPAGGYDSLHRLLCCSIRLLFWSVLLRKGGSSQAAGSRKLFSARSAEQPIRTNTTHSDVYE